MQSNVLKIKTGVDVYEKEILNEVTAAYLAEPFVSFQDLQVAVLKEIRAIQDYKNLSILLDDDVNSIVYKMQQISDYSFDEVDCFICAAHDDERAAEGISRMLLDGAQVHHAIIIKYQNGSKSNALIGFQFATACYNH